MQRFVPCFGSVLICLVWCGIGTASADEGREAAAMATRQQLAATIVALEVSRHHVQQWESSTEARALVARMMDDIVSSAELDTTWQSRFLTTAEDDRREQPDDFERIAMQKLAVDGIKTKQLWNIDGKRVVSGVLAHKSCTNCHDVVVGNVVAYVSLRFNAVERKTAK